MDPNMAKVAAIIEPHVNHTRIHAVRGVSRTDVALSLADDLHHGGLLAFGPQRPPQRIPVQERAAAVLQCRLDWGPAERIAADLAKAGLLRVEA